MSIMTKAFAKTVEEFRKAQGVTVSVENLTTPHGQKTYHLKVSAAEADINRAVKRAIASIAASVKTERYDIPPGRSLCGETTTPTSGPREGQTLTCDRLNDHGDHHRDGSRFTEWSEE